MGDCNITADAIFDTYHGEYIEKDGICYSFLQTGNKEVTHDNTNIVSGYSDCNTCLTLDNHAYILCSPLNYGYVICEVSSSSSSISSVSSESSQSSESSESISESSSSSMSLCGVGWSGQLQQNQTYDASEGAGDANLAFDGVSTTGWWSNISPGTEWIEVQFDVARRIRRYGRYNLLDIRAS